MIRGPGLIRYAALSVVAALVTIALKGTAYLLTGSIGLLSDALESLVNLVAAVVALIALWVAARPADEDHAYGHTKAEYFSSGFEGALILVAAASIVFSAVERLLHPLPIRAPTQGLAITGAATIVNLIVARVLFKAGRQHESIALEADAHHLMSDVWTSVGVIAGVGAAVLTGGAGSMPLSPSSWPPMCCAPASPFSAARCSACWIPVCPRIRAGRSPPFSRLERRRAYAITLFEPARPGPGASSHSTFSCRATGACRRDMICWSKSRRKFAPRFPIAASIPTSTRGSGLRQDLRLERAD